MPEESSHQALPRLPSLGITLAYTLLFFLISFGIYGQTIGFQFVAWDDTTLVLTNPTVRGFSFATLQAAFTTFDPELYVPATMLSYQLNYVLGGLNPAGYHLFNLLFHTFNALLVVWLSALLLRKWKWGMFCGALFLLHPLHTEAIAWVSGRKDLLSTFFVLSTIITYIIASEQLSKKLYVLSIVTHLFALLSKIVAAPTPVLLLLIDWREGRLNKKSIIGLIPHLLLSIIFGIVGAFGKQEIAVASTLLQKILMAGKSSIFYLQKLLIPTDLSVMYAYTKSIIISSADFWLPLIIIGILLTIIIRSLKYTKDIALFAAIFALFVIPSFINFAKSGFIYFASDRYAYLPSIGFFLLVAWMLQHWLERPSSVRDTKNRSDYILYVSMSVFILFSWMSIKQTQTWENSESLFRSTINRYEEALPAYINLSIVLRESGRFDEALNILKKAAERQPFHKTWTAIGDIHYKQGRFLEAKNAYIKAKEIFADSPEAEFGLGLSAAALMKPQEAQMHYERAIALKPTLIEAYNNLGALLLSLKEYVPAASVFQKGIEQNPNFADLHYNLGLALWAQKKKTEAYDAFKEAVRLSPQPIDALISFASVSLELGRNTDALTTLKKVLTLDPKNSEAKAILQQMLDKGIVGKKQ